MIRIMAHRFIAKQRTHFIKRYFFHFAVDLVFVVGIFVNTI